MFASRYYAPRYFALRYWPSVGAEITTDSPACVIQNYLINQGLATNPIDGGSWPVYCGLLPDSPDNAIAVFDTTGISQGKAHVTGETFWNYGIQVMVRSKTESVGSAKVLAIYSDFENLRRHRLTLQGIRWQIDVINLPAGHTLIGYESEASRRRIYTMNLLVPMGTI